jgi:hypothetical protein
VGIGTIFSPLSSTSISGLQPRLIGAGAGIYNMSRQVGNVLGSAAAGVMMQAQLAATNDLTEAARNTMLLPAVVLFAAVFFAAGMRKHVPKKEFALAD